MNYALKILLMIWVAVSMAFGETLTLPEFAGLLLLSAAYVVRTRYWNSPLLMAGEGVLVLAMSNLNPLHLAFLGATAHDLAVKKLAPLALLLVLPGGYFLGFQWLLGYGLLLALCTYAGIRQQQLDEAKSIYQKAYDQERKNRYMLEETKNKLLQAAGETAHLAEVRERNRIAREIHDSIGHDLAGNLLQLQAAEKIMDRDLAKTRELIRKTVTGLAGSVELLRSTVHNIRPKQVLGWSHFEQIIDNFQYCPVEFNHHGSFALMTPHQVEILTSILKESLTNTARHSDATCMTVTLEVREKIIRLVVQDNGSGVETVREGMGISGMRERIHHAGGSFSVNPREGFMIVCVLPREEERGGDGNVESDGG